MYDFVKGDHVKWGSDFHKIDRSEINRLEAKGLIDTRDSLSYV